MRVYFNDLSGFCCRVLSSRLADFGHEIVSPGPEPSAALSAEPPLAFLAAVDAVFLDLTNLSNERYLTDFLTVLKSVVLDRPLLLVGLSSILTWNMTAKSAKKVLR